MRFYKNGPDRSCVPTTFCLLMEDSVVTASLILPISSSRCSGLSIQETNGDPLSLALNARTAMKCTMCEANLDVRPSLHLRQQLGELGSTRAAEPLKTFS